MKLTRRLIQGTRFESERVALHGLRQLSRGKNFSMPLGKIRNPRKAFLAAIEYQVRHVQAWWKRAQREAQDGDFFGALERIDWIRDSARIHSHDDRNEEDEPLLLAMIPMRFLGLKEYEVDAFEQRQLLKCLEFNLDLLRSYGGDDSDVSEILLFVKEAGVTLEQAGTSWTELRNLSRRGAEDTVALFLGIPPYGEPITSMEDFDARLAQLEDET